MARLITKAKSNKKTSNNGEISFKQSKYVKKHSNLRKYLISSIILNVITISYLIYLTTIK